MLPAIGSLNALNSGGRLGVMVDARPQAEPADSRQLAPPQLRTVDQRDAQGQAAARVSGLAPLPAEASERPGPSRRLLAAREERAAAAVARLAEQPSGLADEPAAPLEEADRPAPEERHSAPANSAAFEAAAAVARLAEQPSGLADELAAPLEEADRPAPKERHSAPGDSAASRPPPAAPMRPSRSGSTPGFAPSPRPGTMPSPVSATGSMPRH